MIRLDDPHGGEAVRLPRRLRRRLARCLGVGRRRAKPIKPVCSRRALDAIMIFECFVEGLDKRQFLKTWPAL